jgi:hypothetical protein
MIRTALLLCTFLSVGFFSTLSAQISFQKTHVVDRTYDFDLTGLNPNALAFYLFGDGHHSYQYSPTHEFQEDDIYDTRVYIIDDKISSPPQTAIPWTSTTSFVTSSHAPGSFSGNPTTGNRIVRIDQSWRSSVDHHVYMIVTFTHPDPQGGAAPPADGKIHLDLDPNVTLVNIPTVAQSWAFSNGQVPSSNNLGPGTITLEWEYFNLMPGETRQVYAKIKIPDPYPSSRVRSGATLTTYNELCNGQSCDIPVQRNFRIARFPHDPNWMTVDQAGIKAQASDKQRLDYSVHFVNEGAYYAKDVRLEVDFTGLNLDPDQIEITNSSAPCYFYIDQVSQKMIVRFDSIMLPSYKQTFPNTYNYSQATGFVDFSICSEENQANGLITGITEIFFDTQASMFTNSVETIVEEAWLLGDVCDFTSNDDDHGGDDEEEVGDRSQNPSDPSMQDLVVSPNPVSDLVQVTYQVNHTAGSEVVLSLYSANGQQVMSDWYAGYRVAGTHSTELNLADLPSGLYLLTVRQADSIQTARVVKW